MDITDEWRNIWSKKQLNVLDLSKINLENLIKVNGFDTGAGNYSEKTWRIMVADVCKRVGLEPNNSVLDVGCGGGAFIYAANEIVSANWYGVDYSKTLIDIARKAIPNGCFVLDEAVNENFSDIN